MANKSIPRPTDGELAILRILWDRGPSTVRQVHDVLAAGRSLVYTTTLKLMQIMTEKGLTRREELGRSHLYEASQGREETQQRLVGHLVDRAFGGSAAKLAMQALTSKPASASELKEIRKLLAAQARKEKDRG